MIEIIMCICVPERIQNAWFRRRVSYCFTRNISFMTLDVPLIRNVLSEPCIVYKGPLVWNSIPHDIQNSCYDKIKIKCEYVLLSNP